VPKWKRNEEGDLVPVDDAAKLEHARKLHSEGKIKAGDLAAVEKRHDHLVEKALLEDKKKQEEEEKAREEKALKEVNQNA